MTALDWHDDARCNGLHALYFPPEGEHLDVRLLKAICGACPVRCRCLNLAMNQEGTAQPGFRHSVYGGLTPLERHRLQRTAPEHAKQAS